MLLSVDNQIAAHYCGRDAIDQLYSRAYATKYPQIQHGRYCGYCINVSLYTIVHLVIVPINKTLRQQSSII